MTIQQNQIRIKVKSYDYNLLNYSCKQIINTAHRTEAKTVGPIPLPIKKRIYCVLRSPHVDKDSREHFELRTYSRIIDLYILTSQTVDALMKLNIPAGVDIEVKL